MSVHGRGVSYFLGEENGIFRSWGRYWRRGSLRVALFWVCLQALLGLTDNPTSPFPWVLGFRRSGYFHSPGLQHPHCNPHVGSEMPHSWWPRSFLLVLLLLMPVPTLVGVLPKAHWGFSRILHWGSTQFFIMRLDPVPFSRRGAGWAGHCASSKLI